LRPLHLTIEGLTSFKTSQEVELSELDLFVITGPTGSGKSSILDAMTFALYGSVARVSSHELRDLISHGSSYMRVCLDFQVDGTHYRVARRMGSNSHQATLERVENGSTVPEVEQGGIRVVNDRLEEIVGLDFKAFTKAVLLPQGAFHEFLKGEVGERRRILIRLLDLGRYETAGQAARREANRLDAIIGERISLIESNYQDATKERLGELQAAADSARKEHAKVQKAKHDGTSVASAAAEALGKTHALSANTSTLEDMLADLNSLASAWPPLEGADRATQEELARTDNTLGAKGKALERARKSLVTTTKRTGDASLLTRLETAASAQAREQDEVTKLEKQLIEARKAGEELASALEGAKRAETEARDVLKAKIKERASAERARSLAEAVVRCSEAAANVAKLDERLDRAKAIGAKAGEKAEEARKSLRHLEQEHAAVALRSGLAPGDHCPVCDSVIEVLPEGEGGIEALLGQTREAVHAMEAKEQTTNDAVVALQVQQQDASGQFREARAVIPKQLDLPDGKDASEALKRAETTVVNVVGAETAAQGVVDRAVQAQSDAKTAALTALATADGISTNQQGAQERLKGALSTLTETFGKKLPAQLDTEIARRRKELGDAEALYERASEEAEVARQKRDEAQKSRTACLERVSVFDQELATSRTGARMACEGLAPMLEDRMLPSFPPEGAERAQLLTAWIKCCDGHVVLAGKSVKKLAKEIDGAATKLESLATKAGITITSQEPADIAAELEAATITAHAVAVAATKDVETINTRIAERKKLEQDVADDRILCALYGTLARELRTDHFIAFVLEESMNQLALQASDELMQISDGRYSLIAEEGSFEVIDHHNADERRSVATLSGGETFLASLSLALALSAGLRELAGTAGGRLEAIFIDEGFGALDLETLDVVVEALERLREGDRMVGVITHVPTLAERIPAGLTVETNGNSSRILVR
jgi:exonuclease SbcC